MKGQREGEKKKRTDMAGPKKVRVEGSIHTDMASVTTAMASPESGLEVRDRMWLKITIPNAFLGMAGFWAGGMGRGAGEGGGQRWE